MIYRSRKHWYGNKEPEQAAVKTENKHIWPEVNHLVGVTSLILRLPSFTGAEYYWEGWRFTPHDAVCRTIAFDLVAGYSTSTCTCIVITGALLIHMCAIPLELTCLKETAARKAAGGCLFFYLYVICYSGTEGVLHWKTVHSIPSYHRCFLVILRTSPLRARARRTQSGRSWTGWAVWLGPSAVLAWGLPRWCVGGSQTR